MKTRLSPIARLEMAESEAWHDYEEAHRQFLRLLKDGSKAEAKRMQKRALGLHRRHAGIMRKILFIHRQALWGGTRG